MMSCFKIPDEICKEIESLMEKFWWVSRVGERKLHWMRWEKLVFGKDKGGWGLKAFLSSM